MTMNKIIFIFFIIASWAVGFSFPARADFTFEKIIDSDTIMPGGPGGTFVVPNAFTEPSLQRPSPGEPYSMAFIGAGALGYQAVYVVNEGVLNNLVDTGTLMPGNDVLFHSFNGFSAVASWPLSISDGGVVFSGENRRSSADSGIFKYDNESLSVVADKNTLIPNGTGTFRGRFGIPDIDGRTVGINGVGREPTQEVVYTVNNGTSQVVADFNTLRPPSTTENFDNFNGGPFGIYVDIDSQNVAFSQPNSSGSLQRGVYTTQGGSLRMVANENTLMPNQDPVLNFKFIVFSWVQIDGENIVFGGAGGSGVHGIYRDRGGQLSVLVDTNTLIPGSTFRTFERPMFPSQDGDHFCFVGGVFGSAASLYCDLGAGLEKVIDLNDMLDGKSPIFFSLSKDGLNGNDLAFKVTFIDRSEAIYVAHYSPANNNPPTADAGPPQAFHAGDTVNLDGSGSNDDNTTTEDLLYNWSFTSKPTGSIAVLTGANTIFPTFVADLTGDYVVSLEVTDEGGLTDVTEVVVSSENAPPNADAGPDQSAIVGELVTFDGSGSYDPDSDPFTLSWIMRSVPPDSTAELTLTGATTDTLTFIPDLPGVYVVELTANDGFVDSNRDEAMVTVITEDDLAEMNVMDAINRVADLPLDSVTTKGNQRALGNFLNQVIAALQEDDIDEAKKKLQDALERTDGCALRGSPDTGGGAIKRDHVNNCVDQALIYPLLQEALDALNGV